MHPAYEIIPSPYFMSLSLSAWVRPAASVAAAAAAAAGEAGRWLFAEVYIHLLLLLLLLLSCMHKCVPCRICC